MENAEINRPRSWNGTRLAGDWLVTLKIDGVRAIWNEEQGWLSRANKPLYNMSAVAARPSPRLRDIRQHLPGYYQSDSNQIPKR